MTARGLVAAGLAVAYSVGAPAVAVAGPPTEVIQAPGFGAVSLYAPADPPAALVLFVSGDGGWNQGVVAMAEALRGEGALVAGIDIRRFMKTLEAGKGCAYPAGQLEVLSRRVQQHRRLPKYIPTILVGYSSGATLVYASLAGAPAETFAGGMSLGFCPDLEITKPVCETRGLTAAPRVPKAQGVPPAIYDLGPVKAIPKPWVVLQGDQDVVCEPDVTKAFVRKIAGAEVIALPRVGHGYGVPKHWLPQFLDAYRAVVKASADAARPAAPLPPEVDDLDLVEVSPTSPGRCALVVFLSGDGGWAELDREVADRLAARGLQVIGWSSLGYYWTPRDPDRAAADLARVLRHYALPSSRPVVLAGYSFGADVLPYLLNRLPPDLARLVRGAVLLGPSAEATFEFHASEWLGGSEGDGRYPTAPEVNRLPVPVTCIRGAEEDGSACPSFARRGVTELIVGSGHHFGGQYDRLAGAIADAIR